MRLAGGYINAVNQFCLISAADHLSIACNFYYPAGLTEDLAEFNSFEFECGCECECSGYRTSARLSLIINPGGEIQVN